MPNPQKTFFARLIALILVIVTPNLQAFTGPGTVSLAGGSSVLQFSPEFFNQFPAFGASLGQYGKATFSGNLKQQNLRIRFPIATGTLNPSRDAQAPFYHIQHAGGLLMVRPNGVSIIFDTPVLETGAVCAFSLTCWSLGATIIANGTVSNYLPGFAQSSSLPSSIPVSLANTVHLDPIDLNLTPDGATGMNLFFGLTPSSQVHFKSGSPFGTLEVLGTGARVVCPLNAHYNRLQQLCK
jgi:hypothetical protein